MSRTTTGEALGLTRGMVRIAAYDPLWQRGYRQMAAGLRAELDGLEVTVEHVGSTAVPYLAAKPIIDITVGVAVDIEASQLVARLRPPRYLYRGDGGDKGGLLFVIEDRPDHRIAHIHVVRTDDPQWARYLAFRDRLRADPAARTEYEQLKRRLAARFPDDRRAYTAAKESFIRSLLPPS